MNLCVVSVDRFACDTRFALKCLYKVFGEWVTKNCDIYFRCDYH